MNSTGYDNDAYPAPAASGGGAPPPRPSRITQKRQERRTRRLAQVRQASAPRTESAAGLVSGTLPGPSSGSSAPAFVPAPIRYVLYARKSTETEDRQVQSIPDQLRLAQKLADENGLTIVHTVTESRSAKAQGTRPGFREVVDLIERGGADGVIAWHPDRLARNAVDGGWILDLLDRGRLRDLRFLAYTFENSPEGKFMLGMIFSQSKYYVDKLSKDVLRGLQSKRERGIYPHRAPEGYVNNLAEHTIEADPERFPVLRRAIDLVLAGALLPSQVLDILNDQWGYRTRPTRKSKGGKLSRTSFYDMLSNPFYCGICVEKDRRGGGDLVYPGIHPKLLTEREFERIQALLGRGERPMAQKHTYALTGLIRCGRCGCQITATRSKGHVYYHCTNSKGVCDRRGIREEALEAQVLSLLDDISVPEWLEPLLVTAVERVLSGADRAIGRHEEEDERRRDRAAEQAERQMQTLMTMRLRDLITDEEYRRQKESLQAEVARLRRDRADSDDARGQAREAVTGAIRYATWAKRAYLESQPEEKRQIAGRLGTKHLLTGGNLLLEPDPVLSVFREAQPTIRTFKPTKYGSHSPKRTASEQAVLHGWASSIAVKLLETAFNLQ